jgi:hypothetical protein
VNFHRCLDLELIPQTRSLVSLQSQFSDAAADGVSRTPVVASLPYDRSV